MALSPYWWMAFNAAGQTRTAFYYTWHTNESRKYARAALASLGFPGLSSKLNQGITIMQLSSLRSVTRGALKKLADNPKQCLLNHTQL